MTTILDQLQHHGTQHANRPAIFDIEGNVWSFGQLWAGIRHIAAQLQGLGVSREQRVAVVLPSGPQAASTILSVAGIAVCVPLSLRYLKDEYVRYLNYLEIDALIVTPGQCDEARRAATDADIPVWELIFSAGVPAAINGAENNRWIEPVWSDANDVALLIHTSGTTSRPKQVLLTHHNILYSAENIARSLQFSKDDRGLNVVPLYHVSGLVSSLIAPLISGTSVVCTPGFSASSFIAWITDFKCTWSTAVPSMYQTLLAWLKHAENIPYPQHLRLLRSGGATLAPATMAALEDIFDVPVIDVYGMTETTSGIVGSPMPPRPRKPGSVGLSYGPELAVLCEDGVIRRTAGLTGEIIARGDCVITAYGGPPEETADAFMGGWLRTGDLGYFDEDGYLFVTGRRRELINRGGENIAPREIDEALLTHPAVAQALAFGIPDARLGETVASVVVLHDHIDATETELQKHVASQLVSFKVPGTIVFLDKLPTGPTGKPQRIGLAEKLGLNAESDAGMGTPRLAPRDKLESLLADIWCEVLELDSVSINSRFVDLGGDSLSALRLFVEMESRLNRRLPASLIVSAETIEELACEINRTDQAVSAVEASVLQPVRMTGSRPPFFYIHGVFGDLLNLSNVIPHLPPEQPVYGLEAIGLHPDRKPDTTIESMAGRYVSALRRVQPTGPYYLGGFCFGGVVAYEVARQLAHLGETTALVAIIDGTAPGRNQNSQQILHPDRLRVVQNGLPYWLNGNKEFGGWRRKNRLRIMELRHRQSDQSDPQGEESNLADFVAERPKIQIQLKEINARALKQYRPKPINGHVTLIRARAIHLSHALLRRMDTYRGWQGLALDGVTVRYTDGDHISMLQEPNSRKLAQVLTESLLQAQHQDE